MPGLSEIERGRSEAAHTVVEPTDVRPYLDPEPDTAFPLRYAFYLLGDVRGKTVLDLGCGSGENIAPLLARGAKVIAVDISEELVQLARKRVEITKPFVPLPLMVGSAYDIALPDGSADVILCSSLLHHLDIPRAMAEMRRLLKPGGTIIVKEPVRFSKPAAMLRRMFPAKEDVSEDEHPLTRAELAQVKEGWAVSGERAFRLPLIPLFLKFLSEKSLLKVWLVDGWLLETFPWLEPFASSRVLKLQKTG
jgi:SAM-dependent methyltransferase